MHTIELSYSNHFGAKRSTPIGRAFLSKLFEVAYMLAKEYTLYSIYKISCAIMELEKKHGAVLGAAYATELSAEILLS